MPNIKLVGNNGQESLDGSNTGKEKMSTIHQYAASLNPPFNSISPRFNYTKESFQKMENPGPGSYSLNLGNNLSQFDTTAAFRASSRDKYSLLRNIMKNSSKNPGPGSHNSNYSSIIKKSFNANLKQS